MDAEHVFGCVAGLREGGQEGEFGGAGVAEDAVHSLAAQDVRQGEGGAATHGGSSAGGGYRFTGRRPVPAPVEQVPRTTQRLVTA
jgi:hypothetical protein